MTNIVFIIEEFAVPSPAQQLLDRFLIGYHRKGVFHSPGCLVTLSANAVVDQSPLQSRAKDFGLEIETSPQVALKSADAVVLVSKGAGATPNARWHREILAECRPEARCFVYGMLAPTAREARDLLSFAQSRHITLAAGSATAHAFRLPEVKIPKGVEKALVVGHGSFLDGEFDALECLQSALGESGLGIPAIRAVAPSKFWQTAYSNEWLPLLSSAISRSNTIQGDAERDGRTQDVVGLRLLEKLAPQPRGWLLDYPGGRQAAVFILNGALEDLNFAVQSGQGLLTSAQLYRPPLPQQEHFSGLAQRIETFFRSGETPSAAEELVTIPTLLEKMKALAASS